MTVMHIDANSAYLSWTAVRLLKEGYGRDIRRLPSVIAGDPQSRHGIVLAKSIPAKRYGVRTGESLFEARRKCPGLLVFPHDFSLYLSFSDAMYRILAEYSPVIQRYSVDECYLDYSGSEAKFGPPVRCAFEIKNRIRDELGFTVNIGVSVNKLLAKMASDFEKPDRVHSLFPEEIEEKMWPLPVEELFMVGRTTARRLREINLNTIGDLAKADRSFLKKILKSHGETIWRYANGIDDSPVIPKSGISQKEVGNSTTIDHDVDSAEEAHRILLALTEMVSRRLRKMGRFASVAAVSITTSEFLRYGHQMRLETATDSTSDIYRHVCVLFDEAWRGEKIRHLGVSLSGLSSECEIRMNLLSQDTAGADRAADSAVDLIRERFGEAAIMRGTFVGRSGSIQGGIRSGSHIAPGRGKR